MSKQEWLQTMDAAVETMLKALYDSDAEQEQVERERALALANQAAAIAKRNNDRQQRIAALLLRDIVNPINFSSNTDEEPFALMTDQESQNYFYLPVRIGSYEFGPGMDIYDVKKVGLFGKKVIIDQNIAQQKLSRFMKG